MSVGYQEALGTLQAMFDGVEKDVIAIMLENNGGHMEKTVDDLLAITGQREIEAEGGERADGGGGGGGGGGDAAVGELLPADFLSLGSSTPAAAAAAAPAAAATAARSGGGGGGGGGGQTLNYDHEQARNAMAGRPDEVDQIMSDAQFAQMLQDEMFIEQLREHPEWMAQAQGGGQHPQHHQQQPQRAGTVTGNQPRNVAHAQNSPAGPSAFDTWKAKWNALSDTARGKLGSMFGGGAAAGGGGGGGAHTGAGGASRAQYTSLPGDDDDDDDDNEVLSFAGGGAGEMSRRTINTSDDDFGTELQDSRTFRSTAATSSVYKKDD